MDAIERRILGELQRDCAQSLTDLSEKVGLSTTPLWKRIKKLEAAGVISGRVAILDPEAVGLTATVFVWVRTSRHDEEWLAEFADTVARIPEVTEFYRLSGEKDYLLKIVCRSIGDYDRIYKQIIKGSALFDVSSSFSMEQIKYSTELPLQERP